MLVFIGGFHLYAQFKQPMINLEHFDEKHFQWGYYFGANTFDFKIDYKPTATRNTKRTKNRLQCGAYRASKAYQIYRPTY